MDDSKVFVVAITGASGVVYGIRLVEALAQRARVDLVVTDGARKVLETEGGKGVDLDDVLKSRQKQVTLLDDSDVGAGPSSGSYRTDGMVVIPCSMDTLSAIASGSSRTLTHRAAHVTLKEGRKLVLVPRETPLNIIFLENLLRVARAGATVLPASPGFYHQPKTIRDQVDFIVGKTLDQFGISHDLFRRWGG